MRFSNLRTKEQEGKAEQLVVCKRRMEDTLTFA